MDGWCESFTLIPAILADVRVAGMGGEEFDISHTGHLVWEVPLYIIFPLDI